MKKGKEFSPKEYLYATKNVGHIFGRELDAKVVSIAIQSHMFFEISSKIIRR